MVLLLPQMKEFIMSSITCQSVSSLYTSSLTDLDPLNFFGDFGDFNFNRTLIDEEAGLYNGTLTIAKCPINAKSMSPNKSPVSDGHTSKFL